MRFFMEMPPCFVTGRSRGHTELIVNDINKKIKGAFQSYQEINFRYMDLQGQVLPARFR